jgi:hypothetical protein
VCHESAACTSQPCHPGAGRWQQAAPQSAYRRNVPRLARTEVRTTGPGYNRFDTECPRRLAPPVKPPGAACIITSPLTRWRQAAPTFYTCAKGEGSEGGDMALLAGIALGVAVGAAIGLFRCTQSCEDWSESNGCDPRSPELNDLFNLPASPAADSPTTAEPCWVRVVQEGLAPLVRAPTRVPSGASPAARDSRALDIPTGTECRPRQI